jgi:hypothetical protein
LSVSVRDCHEIIFMRRSTLSRLHFIKISVASAVAAIFAPFEIKAEDSAPTYLTLRISSGEGKMATIKTLRFDEIDSELDRCLDLVAEECIRIGAAYGGELYKERILLELSSNGYQVAVFAVLESYVKRNRKDIARMAYKRALLEARARYEHYCVFGDLPFRIDDKSRPIKAW